MVKNSWNQSCLTRSLVCWSVLRQNWLKARAHSNLETCARFLLENSTAPSAVYLSTTHCITRWGVQKQTSMAKQGCCTMYDLQGKCSEYKQNAWTINAFYCSLGDASAAKQAISWGVHSDMWCRKKHSQSQYIHETYKDHISHHLTFKAFFCHTYVYMIFIIFLVSFRDLKNFPRANGLMQTWNGR